MSNYLITGHFGTNHITSDDAASLNKALVGSGSYVMSNGNKLKATIKSNNLVRISDGDVVHHGRHARIPQGSYCDCAIENGTAGTNRIDLIVLRYVKATDGTESADIKVIKGTGDTVPEYTSGDVENGDLLDEMPLYKVNLEGITITSVDALFSTVDATAVLKDTVIGHAVRITAIEADIANEVKKDIAFLDARFKQIVTQCAAKGQNSISFASASTTETVVLSMDIPLNNYGFKETPTVNATVLTRYPDKVHIGIGGVSKTGFTVYISRAAGTPSTSIAFSWTAIGEKA